MGKKHFLNIILYYIIPPNCNLYKLYYQDIMYTTNLRKESY